MLIPHRPNTPKHSLKWSNIHISQQRNFSTRRSTSIGSKVGVSRTHWAAWMTAEATPTTHAGLLLALQTHHGSKLKLIFAAHFYRGKSCNWECPSLADHKNVLLQFFPEVQKIQRKNEHEVDYLLYIIFLTIGIESRPKSFSSLRLSLSLSGSVSVCLSVYLPVCLFFCLLLFLSAMLDVSQPFKSNEQNISSFFFII